MWVKGAIAICLIMIMILPEKVMPGTSGKTAPAGEVENILEMNVVPFENLSTVLPEFRKYDTPVGGVIIAAFTISNNDANGFQITIKSDQGGKLVRSVDGQYVSNVKDGDFINYTLHLERGPGGQLGAKCHQIVNVKIWI